MTSVVGELRPLNVLLTFDIEVWCGGWQDLDAKFPEAFRRYVYGSSRAGNYALPRTLEIMNDHDLKGVFFVEPLFASRFGLEPLAEIVGLIKDAGQEIQLHLHPEWQNESIDPLIPNHVAKRQGLIHYDLEEQTALIGHGIRLLQEAGAGRPTAFRSGGYSCNADTYTALERNGIFYDSSLNVTLNNSGVGLPDNLRRPGAHYIGRILELPLFIFRASTGRVRYVQVGSCATPEFVEVLEDARMEGWSYVTVISHNFEMLLRSSHRPDWIVVRRFEKLCRHLADNRDIFPTVWFSGGSFVEESPDFRLPMTSAGANMQRFLEQGYRRVLESCVPLTG
ncbi:MAG: polysaccharide deacetylase [Gallionellaceae bacterium]